VEAGFAVQLLTLLQLFQTYWHSTVAELVQVPLAFAHGVHWLVRHSRARPTV